MKRVFSAFLLLNVGGCTQIDAEPSDAGGEMNEAAVHHDPFRIVVLADPHVPGPSYLGPEANELDTESILAAEQRLLDARATINALEPAPDFVVILGDILHTDYPYDEVESYFEADTAFSRTAEILAGFEVPVYPVFGDHDYGIPRISREQSHVLFEHFFDVQPYTAIDHKGWKFILANTQLGDTWDTNSEGYNPLKGSYGPEQLEWIAEQLFDRKPTVFLSHYPIPFETALWENEHSPAVDIFTLMTDHADLMKLALAGHLHRWIDYRVVAPIDIFVMAGLRYDEDNFWVIELDAETESYEILDMDKVHWQTPYADASGL